MPKTVSDQNVRLQHFLQMQFFEFKPTFGSADLNPDYEEVEDGFSCRPEHWKTSKFVGNIVFIKEEKCFNSFKFGSSQFCCNHFCCCEFYVTILRLVTQCWKLHTHWFKFYPFLFYVKISLFATSLFTNLNKRWTELLFCGKTIWLHVAEFLA